MYTSERVQNSKGYRAAELCCNLGEELGTDCGEDRDRFSAELSPSIQRLPWTSRGGQQPCGQCQVLWSCAASNRCLCSSSSPLAAARRVCSAGSTAVRWLKERCSLHQVLHFTRGKKLNTAGGRARVEFDERTDAECAHASESFLEFVDVCSH